MPPRRQHRRDQQQETELKSEPFGRQHLTPPGYSSCGNRGAAKRGRRTLRAAPSCPYRTAPRFGARARRRPPSDGETAGEGISYGRRGGGRPRHRHGGSGAGEPRAGSGDAPATANILLADWTGPYDGVPPWDQVRPELFPRGLPVRDRRAAPRSRGDRRQSRRADLRQHDRGARAAPASGSTGSKSIWGVMTEQHVDARLSGAGARMGSRASPPPATRSPSIPRSSSASAPSTRRARRAGLNAQQQRLVTRRYEAFVRRGANLDAAQKQQLTAYNQELARAVRRVQREGARTTRKLSSPSPRRSSPGVPADVRSAAAAAARERNLPAGQFAIVNTRSAVDPVLTFADNRALARAGVARVRQPRRQWRRQRHQRDHRPDRPLRADRARLLGYPSHAAWRMQDTMASTPERAHGADDAGLARRRRARERRSRDMQAMARPARASTSRSSRGTIAITWRRSAASALQPLAGRDRSPISSSTTWSTACSGRPAQLYGLQLQGNHRRSPGLSARTSALGEVTDRARP